MVAVSIPIEQAFPNRGLQELLKEVTNSQPKKKTLLLADGTEQAPVLQRW
jgi:hypothetical protein